ncbi:hypothetical protein YC2023_008574 [Brassica napus]
MDERRRASSVFRKYQLRRYFRDRTTTESGGGVREREMIPQQWTPPCGSQCTHKYAALTQIPWRVFCKKGCDADSDSWEDCVSDCSEICYKDPVLKDRQWSAYIDRSPGAASYSEFEVGSEEVDKVKPKRPPPPPPKPQPPPRAKGPKQPPSEEVPGTSA